MLYKYLLKQHNIKNMYKVHVGLERGYSPNISVSLTTHTHSLTLTLTHTHSFTHTYTHTHGISIGYESYL